MFFINKKNQLIITNLLGIGLIYVLYQQSALTQEQILLYIGLQTIGINLLFFQQKIIKFLSLPFILGIGFFLLLGFLPLFKDSPDTSTFYLGQQMEYIFLGNPTNVEIKETGELGEQKIVPIQNNQKIFLIESSSRTIIFNEKIVAPQEKNKFVIKFPNNTIYIVYPGSKISIQKNGNLYTLIKEYGSAEYYQPDNNTQVHITPTADQEQKNKSDFSLSYMIEQYKTLQTKYSINQAGGILIMQPFYQRFSKNIIDFAYRIWPNIYVKNRENYKKYKELLGRKQIENTYTTDEKWRTPVLQQIQKGRKETRVLY